MICKAIYYLQSHLAKKKSDSKGVWIMDYGALKFYMGMDIIIK